MKWQVYKKILALLLSAAALFSAVGCVHRADEPTYKDENCFEQFMDKFSHGDYEGAYALLASDVKTAPNSSGATVEGAEGASGSGAASGSSNYILKDDFVKKYTDIFNALGLTSVSYQKKNESVSGSRKTVDYTAVYTTEKAGELEADYTMNLKLDGNSWRVDWSPALIFPEMTWGSTVRVTKTSARRGDILAGDKIIALTADTDAVYVERDKLPEDTDSALASAAELLGIDLEKTREKLEKSKSNSIVIGEFISEELPADVRERIDGMEGFGIIKNYGTQRVYPYDSLMAHTLGYVGYASEAEAAKLNEGRSEADGLYSEDSIIGKSGLEQAYEPQLRGKDGYNITVRNADGEFVKLLYKKPAEDGIDVHLTVDYDIQKRTEELLDLVLWGDDTSGAVVVMDPTTGAVKSIASYPTYDLNTLSDNYSALLDMPTAPLFNRTTQGLYPPGSAFKVFTATAAMETGTIDSSYTFTGTIRDDYWYPTGYGRWIWPPIKRAEVFNRATPLNMENGLIHSDNIYFADIALKMGETKFFNYLRSIGMEKKMPFELNVATSTIKKVGDNATDEEWNLRSIAETGYGQGQVTITPLQLATMFCAFRNGGSIPAPYVTDSFYTTDGTDYHSVETFGETTWIADAIHDYSIAVLTPMMEHVVSLDYNGTGRPLKARGCTVAGKTGTAEKTDDKSREVSWFVGFRTGVAEEDELLVLVVLEIPTSDEYKYLKFDIARELISMPSEEPQPTE